MRSRNYMVLLVLRGLIAIFNILIFESQALGAVSYSLFQSTTVANLKAFYNNEPVSLSITRAAGFRFDLGIGGDGSQIEGVLSTALQLANDLSSIDVLTAGAGIRYFIFDSVMSHSASKGQFKVSSRQSFSPFLSSSFIVTRVSLGFTDADGILRKVGSSTSGINLAIGIDWLPNLLQKRSDGYRYSDDPRRAFRTEISYSYAPLTTDSSPGFYSDLRLVLGITL